MGPTLLISGLESTLSSSSAVRRPPWEIEFKQTKKKEREREERSEDSVLIYEEAILGGRNSLELVLK